MAKMSATNLSHNYIKKQNQIVKRIEKTENEIDFIVGHTDLKISNAITRKKSNDEMFEYKIGLIDKKYQAEIEKLTSSERATQLKKLNQTLESHYWSYRKDHEKFIKKLIKTHDFDPLNIPEEYQILIDENLKLKELEHDNLKNEYQSQIDNLNDIVSPDDLKTAEELKPVNKEAVFQLHVNYYLNDLKLINKQYKNINSILNIDPNILELSENLINQASLLEPKIDVDNFELIEKRNNLYFQLIKIYNEEVRKIKTAKLYTKLELLEQDNHNFEELIIAENVKYLESLKEQLENADENLKESISKKIQVIEDKLDMQQNQDIHLRLKNLTMQFGGLTAVNNLSFDIKRGEVFSLIGPNGAGKTTVFNCITQFYEPTSGQVYFNNKFGETKTLTDYKVNKVIHQGISRTFQNIELILELTVLENLLVGAHSLYRSNFFSQIFHLPKMTLEEKVIRQKAINILARLDLLPYMNLYPVGLPYGILKKIEFARTLMTNPELIILDEPAAGLNESETLELAKLIKQIQKEFDLTIFLVEHDMSLVMRISDTVCAISFGKELAIGTPEFIQKHPAVREAYLGGENNE